MLVFGTDSSQSAGTHTGILHGTEVQLSRCVPKAEVPAGRSRAGSQPRSAAGGQSPACTWDSCTMCALGGRLEKRQGLQPRIFFKLIPEAHTFLLSCTWEVSQPFQEHDPLWMNMLLIRKALTQCLTAQAWVVQNSRLKPELHRLAPAEHTEFSLSYMSTYPCKRKLHPLSQHLLVYMIKLLSGKRYRAKFSKSLISSEHWEWEKNCQVRLKNCLAVVTAWLYSLCKKQFRSLNLVRLLHFVFIYHQPSSRCLRNIE